jgi:hypothetical protein
MGRRQAAQTYDSSVKERNSKTYPSNPRGLDARALTKRRLRPIPAHRTGIVKMKSRHDHTQIAAERTLD